MLRVVLHANQLSLSEPGHAPGSQYACGTLNRGGDGAPGRRRDEMEVALPLAENCRGLLVSGAQEGLFPP